MPTISVVIPVLNDAEMLRTCLSALAAQTRSPDEIIVVDNGSTDDSANVAREAGVRLVVEPVRGIPSATAAGLDAATGDILARLDADSIPPSDWLERIEDRLQATDGLTALTGPGDFYGANAFVRKAGRVLYIGGLFWSMHWMLGHYPLFGSNYAIPAELWRRVRENVHRDVRAVHDDLDLSYQLQPDMDVIYDRDLRVRISARPFASPASMGRRLAWVFTTLSLDFRDNPPVSRRRARSAWRRRRDETGYGASPELGDESEPLGESPEGLVA